MAEYCVYAKLNLEALNEIQSVRKKFDPLASKIAPHLTLVFPFWLKEDPGPLLTHFDQSLKDEKEIPFSLLPPIAKDSYVFFPMKDTSERLRIIFDRLNSGFLARFRSHQYPFDPHITLGRYQTDAERDLILAAAQKVPLGEGKISEIYWEEILTNLDGFSKKSWRLLP